jgi:hypothetical protein
MARFFGGGTRWTMHDHSVWRPAYSMLLSPAHWFTSDSAAVYRVALGLNAVLGGLTALVLYWLARRLTVFGPIGCAAVAGCVALTPARLFTTEFVWSESLTVLVYSTTVLALLRFWSEPGRPNAVAVALIAALGFATHSRLLPLSFVALAVIVLAARAHRVTPLDAAIATAANLAGLAAGLGLTRLATSELWRDPSDINSVGAVAERLLDPGAILVALAGQVWYQLVASLGIAAIGAWVLVTRAFATTPGAAPSRADSRLVGVSVLTLSALSVVFMSGRTRADQVVYGRYIDAVTSPVLIVGLATLVGAATTVAARRRILVAAGIALTTLVTAVVTLREHDSVLDASDGIEPMILGLQSLRTTANSIDVAHLTLVALVLGAGLLGATFAGRHAPAAIGIGLLVAVGVAGVRTDDVLTEKWPNRGDHRAVVELADGPLPSGSSVDFFVPAESNSTNRLMLYQMYLAGTEFTVVEDPLTTSSSSLVFADPENASLVSSGAERIWTDQFNRISLWEREPSGR